MNRVSRGSKEPHTRNPSIKTIRRSNVKVQALSLPKITLFKMRSIWSKLNGVVEDIENREADACMVNEVWKV